MNLFLSPKTMVEPRVHNYIAFTVKTVPLLPIIHCPSCYLSPFNVDKYPQQPYLKPSTGFLETQVAQFGCAVNVSSVEFELWLGMAQGRYQHRMGNAVLYTG